MAFFQRTGLWLSRTKYGARVLEERSDLSAFKRPVTVRLVVGVACIALSFLVGGWPTIALIGIVAGYLGEPLVFVIGGPGAYGLSWLIYLAGIYLAGKESIHYGNIFFRWCFRVLITKMIGDVECEDLERPPDG